jgi:mono/diheme cytochrome c family protein
MNRSDWIGLILVAVGSAAGIAHTFTGPASPPPDIRSTSALSPTTRGLGLGESTEQQLANELASLFGSWDSPSLENTPFAWAEKDAEAWEGAPSLYARKCAHCHGNTGAADTTTASMLAPKPRDLSLGVMKFTSTPMNQAPLLSDIEDVTRDGIPSTAMAGFSALSKSDLRAVSLYTAWLLFRGDTEQRAAKVLKEHLNGIPNIVAQALADAQISWSSEAIPIPKDLLNPNSSSASRGAQLIQDPKAGCTACHGPDLKGKGPASWSPTESKWLLQDIWGNQSRPRGLFRETLAGGDSAEDLFRQIAIGIKGTPMPGAIKHLSTQEIADIVQYILQERRKVQ